jgi:hypothetical protein
VAFDPPLRSEMGAVVLRALRDPSGSVFPIETVNDFIAQAMADLSAYRPKEAREVAAWPLDIAVPPFTGFTSVWRVEFRVARGTERLTTIGIPFGDSNSAENRAGWDFYGGELIIPPFWLVRLDTTAGDAPAELVVWGYQDRDIPVNEFDVLDLTDATDYNCVLNHCKSLGFELLTHDRALYQQWLAATNNTDVSPTQLSGMAGQAEGTFQRTRSRNTKMRRIPSGDYVHAY